MTATTPMTATTADRGTERDRPPGPPPGLAPDAEERVLRAYFGEVTRSRWACAARPR